MFSSFLEEKCVCGGLLWIISTVCYNNVQTWFRDYDAAARYKRIFISRPCGESGIKANTSWVGGGGIIATVQQIIKAATCSSCMHMHMHMHSRFSDISTTWTLFWLIWTPSDQAAVPVGGRSRILLVCKLKPNPIWSVTPFVILLLKRHFRCLHSFRAREVRFHSLLRPLLTFQPSIFKAVASGLLTSD